MGTKKNKGGGKGGAKIRVDFKRNRNSRTRVVDWTRKYEEGLAAGTLSNAVDDSDDSNVSNEFGGLRVSGKSFDSVGSGSSAGTVETANPKPSPAASDSSAVANVSASTNLNRSRSSSVLKTAVSGVGSGFSSVDDAISGERIVGKGDLVRKRTVVGTYVGAENPSGERGDFDVLPDVDLNVCQKGRVLSVHGLNSFVEDERGRVFSCVTRRILKTLSTNQRQVVVAGDRVYFRDARLPDGRLEGIVERVEPRRGTLSRTSWNRKHVVVANVEQAVIMTSAAEPRLKPNLIDRLLVTCERSGIRPIICVNKIDLVEPGELQPLIGVYAKMGYQTVLFSAKTGFNLDRLRRLLVGRESVVVGQSGVGKSSALNAIDPSLNLRVGAVSQENHKGKHTTTTARLLKLSFGGYVVDTPGIRQFMLWDFAPEEVVGYYRDLRPYENLCKFPDCAHICETSCAVKDAVADGRLDARRYESYLALRSGEMEKMEKLE